MTVYLRAKARFSTVEIKEQGTPAYERPTVVDYGTLRELTAGHKTGANLDASFPVGTPNDKLTFSTPAG
jgi:hypothetical protein